MEKFHRHWQHRLGLETIKLRQAAQSGAWPSEAQKEANAAEVTAYIESCYQYEKDRKMDNVYVTDHKAAPKKFLTNGEEEDQDYYDYQQSLKDYYATGKPEAAKVGGK
jgi:metal-dependent hydrolase (beta-lactamase superfamily II)